MRIWHELDENASNIIVKETVDQKQNVESQLTFPSQNETALWIVINRAQRSIYREMDQALKLQGLPPLRWYDVLWAIERSGKTGIQAYMIEESLIFEQSNLSRLLRRVINEGLVQESVVKGDRRGKLLKITKKGQLTRQKMWEVYGPLIHTNMEKIPQDQLLDLTGKLQALLVSCR